MASTTSMASRLSLSTRVPRKGMIENFDHWL
jgi:hypothetical protein